MHRSRKVLAVLITAVVLVSLMPPMAFAVKPLLPNEMGAQAYTYVETLTQAPRVAGTAGELAAAEQVKDWFADAGYSAEFQPFTYTRRGTTYSSQNVVAFHAAEKKPKSDPVPLVIIGAHYDAVSAGKGSDDNASGVAVMLEVAERIAKYKPEYDIAFVAFGAEEVGLRGSAFYANSLSAADKERAICMINFDSLIVGDKLYIHAGANGKTWARDEMLRLIGLRNLPIEIQPGLHPDYPAGLTPDGFSDYTAFNQAGIPVVAFESTNWEIGDLDGYEQTEEFGSFWHTPNDDLAIIEQLLPGRPMERLDAYTTLVFEFLKHLNP
jgi:Zn-dependent M28 family amino/carboxypeptidase